MHVVVTRPQPGATAAKWRGRGATVTVAPLLAVTARAWLPPADPPGAVALTSANGARLAGDGARAYHHAPLFAVGAATAKAAIDAGWIDVRDVAATGGGTVAALYRAAAAAGVTSLLHLAGIDRIVAAVPPGLTVVIREVYAATLLDLPGHVATLLDGGRVDGVLLYSPRTAAHFAAQVDAVGIDRARVGIVALSPAIATAAGVGWRAVEVAGRPDDAALFAAATALCDKGRSRRSGA